MRTERVNKRERYLLWLARRMRYAIIFLDRKRSSGMSLEVFCVFLTSMEEDNEPTSNFLSLVRVPVAKQKEENEFTGT